ncbi:hypothetical protein KUTeg_011075 [Tegillarca granosa]|uniref:Mab-21-like HhH/H2TH-like domain-containing protein n=1 Tax=Tegillarca granosa TaxID=220873 RepID=A0ABQ9F2T9_TEGGR|nr:hypothetical protein KUTeg_011075 [Tegillarca granosa]
MEHISSALWEYLSIMLGTEVQVYIRRRIFALYNSIEEQVEGLRKIPSGSRAEGLSIPGSDIDTMVVLDHISVSENPDDLDIDIVMITKDIKPGFAKLCCQKNYHNYFRGELIKTHEGCFLSSLFTRDALVHWALKRHPDAIAHGPCSSFQLQLKLENDILVCLHCKTWPQIALEWINRRRHYGWPSSDLIQNIVQDGYFLVPIGNPNSQDSHLQWRISFSLAEKKLVYSFNPTQFLCYGLLKLFLKHAINSNEQVKDLLCSYFLKTSLFYCIEEENIVWNQENFLHCFWTCIRRLLKWILDEYCPNYFIKENNMFEGKICGRNSKVLYDYLFELYNNGLDSLRHIPGFSELNCKMFATNSLVIRNELRETLCDIEVVSKLKFYYGMNGLKKEYNTIIQLLQQTTDPIDRTILTLRFSRIVDSFVPLVCKDIQTTTLNKKRYRQIKGLKQFIIDNCLFGDKCTGMLLLATLCYLCGEYKEVVIIVQKVLKKIKYYTFYIGYVGKITYNHQYISAMCGKGLTLNQKLAHFSRHFICVIDHKFYPQEIETELVQHSTLQTAFIPPVVYCNVLLCLSYYHMECKNRMRDTLNELYIAVVHDERFINEEERPLANALLQRSLQICGN